MDDGWHITFRNVAHQWMCDHFGHVNVRHYASFFDDASFGLWSITGVGPKELAKHGVHTVVARTETDFRREVLAGTTLLVKSRWVEVGSKSLTYVQHLESVDDGTVHASQRAVEVFFDPKTRSSRPIPDELRSIFERAANA